MDFILGIDTIHATSKVMVAKDWIRENGVDPKKVLFIGDTDHDYEVATSIGVDCLLIANGHQSKERLLKVTSNVVDDIIDTLEVIF